MHHERLKQFHCRSVEKARKAGIPAYFFLDEVEGVLRVLPDGRKERIVTSQGQPVVLSACHGQPQQLALG